MAIKRNAMNARTQGFSHDEPESVKAILGELREDLKQFAQTRIQLFVAELKAKFAAWKAGGLSIAIALVFALGTFLLFTGAIVSLIAMFLGAALALLIMGVVYLVITAVAGWLGYKQITTRGIAPKRTVQLLKEDRAWLQDKAKS